MAGKSVFDHCNEKATRLLHDVCHEAKELAKELDSKSFDLEEQLLWHFRCV
jgi:hypothetical protein